MRKYIYVCPRCGRAYIRYIPRRNMHCPVCDTVWKTRKAKGTSSYFSWKATIVFLAIVFSLTGYVLYRYGLFFNF